MKKLLTIMVLGLLLSGNAYSETWICKSKRFGELKWEIDKKYIYEVFPNDDARKYKITKDFSKNKISIFGVSKGGAMFDYDVYLDFNNKSIKVRQFDREFGISGEYYNTDCKIFK
ncbi:MAG: hypothetical protein CBD16_04625 [Betaproteobacteria bacterium TMED156]|nr:MAG: hypothetical protein CBD16_04625 [Betaproteobacteria bacterium TMED156]